MSSGQDLLRIVYRRSVLQLMVCTVDSFFAFIMTGVIHCAALVFAGLLQD